MNPGTKLGLFLHLMLLKWTRGQTPTPTTETVEVYSRTDVVLSCSAPPDTDLKDVILEWIRPDLKKKDVFMFRDRKPYLYYQHHQFKGRIEVTDPSFKSGDLSIILKNTTLQDSGLYRCHLINLSNITEQSVLAPIKVVNLKVLGPEPVEVYSRTDVDLSCSAPPDTDLKKGILEWTRSDLKDSNVFMFRDRKPYLFHQHHQFRGRTELKDPSFKSGDLSIILKNTTQQDSGEYRCLFIRRSHIRKRSLYNIPPIKVVNLKVLGPERETRVPPSRDATGGGCRFEAGFGFVASVFISLILQGFF